jgi:hypothetical protein
MKLRYVILLLIITAAAAHEVGYWRHGALIDKLIAEQDAEESQREFHRPCNPCRAVIRL